MYVERVDASRQDEIVELARRYSIDLIHNAVDPVFNEAIFDAAFEAECTYMDMAMTLSHPNPIDPTRVPGITLGDYQFQRSSAWEEKGLLALVGMGVEPGLADVFARYAADHLFDSIDEIGVRDGANLDVRGYEFAPSKRVMFKYGLGREFIDVLKTLHMLGLDNKDPIEVKGVRAAPRDVVAACLPDPAHLGDRMVGKTCAGTWVTGMKDGRPREVYLYQVADNEVCMCDFGVQAVVWQAAVNPVIAMELLETGAWKGIGVLGPEAFEPDPFLDRLAEIAPWGIEENPTRTPGAA